MSDPPHTVTHMTIPTAPHPDRAPQPTAPAWASLQRVGHGRWRVSDRRRRIIGHVRAVHVDGGWRFVAERFNSATRAFREIGRFWSPDEALECLRFSV